VASTRFSKTSAHDCRLSERDIITYFSGTRAATYEEDFVVQKGKWTDNILHAAGIQSPGVTAAPAIGEDIAKWASEMLKTPTKDHFISGEKGRASKPASFRTKNGML
jgi:glycine/D-amino acid oxidase-like deaminating enzyme